MSVPEGAPAPNVTVISIHPMYSAGQVTAATCFGGPLGGAWLMALNYKRLGEPAKARMAIGLSVLAMAVLLACGFAIPGRSTWWLRILPIVGIRALAKALQGAAYERHVAAGGSRGSSWRAVGIGLASSAIYLGIIVGGAVVYEYATAPDEIVTGESNIRYTGGATRAEAQSVGDALTALGYVRPGARVTVQLTIDHGRHVVELVVQDFVFSDDETQQRIHQLADLLSRKAFAGAQVDLWLTDDELEPRVKLTWETRPRSLDVGDGHIVVYRQGIQETEARGVAKVLQEQGLFRPGHSATVMVETVRSRYIVAIALKGNAFDDAELRTALHRLAEPCSDQAFGGQPVDIWLDDLSGVTRNKLSWESRPR